MLLFTLFLGLNVIYVIAEPPRARLWLWDIDARKFGYDLSIIDDRRSERNLWNCDTGAMLYQLSYD